MLRRTFLKLSFYLTALAGFFTWAEAAAPKTRFYPLTYWVRDGDSARFYSEQVQGVGSRELLISQTATNIALWDVSLTEDELYALAHKAPATIVRPDRLRLLYPFHQASWKPLRIKLASAEA